MILENNINKEYYIDKPIKIIYLNIHIIDRENNVIDKDS